MLSARRTVAGYPETPRAPVCSKHFLTLGIGFSSFLDVVGVERYLVGRGFTFTEDAVELSMDGLSISNQISELETDIFGGADSTSVPLPFGLVDVGATEIQDGLLSPRSLGSPNLDNDWMQVSFT